MIDLNSSRSLTDRIIYLLDRVESKESPRKYLGASTIGHACERKVQYDLLAALGEIPTPNHNARMTRIFRRGHVMEAELKSWLRDVGIVVEEGPSFRMDDLHFGGHTDGLVTAAPDHLGITLPCLFEAKCLKQSSFAKLKKEGLRSYSDTYWAQIQTYMAATGVIAPALYVVVNADTMEIHAFTVEVEPATAEKMHRRVEHLNNLVKLGELAPRMTTDWSHWQCKFCDFHERCWA